ncbi:hypothetical protein HDU85_006050 [Gaertneriomyces sp. JEL0708]|nr:hypothetical protein HDU85_006050 [Gaertneriomyces sp. JEL0708]
MKWPTLMTVTEFLETMPNSTWADYVAHADEVLACLDEVMMSETPNTGRARIWKEKRARAIEAKTEALLEREQGIHKRSWEVTDKLASSQQVRSETVRDFVQAPRTRPSKRQRRSLFPVPSISDTPVTERESSPVSAVSDDHPEADDNLCEWRQRVVDSLAALKAQEEVLLNGVNAAKVLRKYQKVLLSSHRKGAPIELKDTAKALAVYGCLLLADQMPAEYHSCVTVEEYRKLVAHFSRRRLPPVELESLAPIIPVVRSMAAAVLERRGAWLPPQLDPRTCKEEEIARQQCYGSLVTSLRAEEVGNCQESTWVSRHVVPLLPLIRSWDIDYDIDATTDYNNKRPDVFLKLANHIEYSGRAICSWEVKPPGASTVEKQKDLARVIISCIRYLTLDYSKFAGESTALHKLAVHLPGSQGTVYEVFLMPKMFVAVEVGKVTLPVSLGSGQEIPVALAIRQMEILFERVRKLKYIMLHDTVRVLGSGKSLLPPTPAKKTKPKPRSTRVQVESSDAGSS